MLVTYSVVYSSQLFVIITRIRYYCLFVSHYSLFDYLLHFHLSFVLICCLKRKRAILNLTLFRYFDPVSSKEVPSTC